MPRAGFEPATYPLGGDHSIQLSYRGNGFILLEFKSKFQPYYFDKSFLTARTRVHRLQTWVYRNIKTSCQYFDRKMNKIVISYRNF